MEPLERLSRRQLETLRAVSARETPEQGVSLKLVATSLKLTAPSALGHLTLLEKLGLVARDRGKSRLTGKGQRTLREGLRHHRIAENLFGRVGLTPEQACQAAREIDLTLSHETVDRLCAASGHSSTCPHGQPIAPCASQIGGR